MLSSDKIFARFPNMNNLIAMLMTHCESNNKKVKHLYRRRCSIQLMIKLVFHHQSALTTNYLVQGVPANLTSLAAIRVSPQFLEFRLRGANGSRE
jgi:DNA polymerase I-like protein with 3'-5' exonuclease and polymerase domains